MSKDFKLYSDFQPGGDQPEAIHKLREGLQDGLAHQTLLGVTGSGKTFTIANVIAQENRPTMLMAHNKTLAAQLYSEMKAFFPDNAVEYFVSYYDYYQPEAYVPSSDTFIEKDASVNEHIEQMRLSATKALLERRDVIVVASVSAIYGLGDPDSYLKMMLHLTDGMIIDQRSILRRLADLQYTRNDQAFTRGLSASVVRLSTFFLRNQTSMPYVLSYLMTKLNGCHYLTHWQGKYNIVFLVSPFIQKRTMSHRENAFLRQWNKLRLNWRIDEKYY